MSQRIHMLHIGKTGGTVVKHALEPFGISLHPHEVTLKEIPVGEKVFFFVRDPISRFVSGFYSRQRKGQPRYNSPWSPDEEKAFAVFATANDLALSLSSTDRATRELAEYAMGSIQHVRSSYWDWFRDETYLRTRVSDILFIGWQETLDQDFARLRELLHLSNSVVLSKRSSDRASHPVSLRHKSRRASCRMA